MKKTLWLLITLLVAASLVLTSCDKTGENENPGEENSEASGDNNGENTGDGTGDNTEENNGENNGNDSNGDNGNTDDNPVVTVPDPEKDKQTLVDILSGNKLGDIFDSMSGETPEWVGALESYGSDMQIDVGGELLGSKKAVRVVLKDNVLYILEKDYTTGELNVNHVFYADDTTIARIVENADGSYMLSGMDISLSEGEDGEIELPSLDSIVFPDTGLDSSKFTEADGWYVLDEEYIKDLIRESYESLDGMLGGAVEPASADITMPDTEDLLDALLTSLTIDVRFAVSGESIQGIRYQIKINDSFFSYLRLVGIGKSYYIKNVSMAGEIMLNESCTMLSSFSISEKVDYKDITDQTFTLNASTVYADDGSVTGVSFDTALVVPKETKDMITGLLESLEGILGTDTEDSTSPVSATEETPASDLSFSMSAKLDLAMLLSTGKNIVDMQMSLVRLDGNGEVYETLIDASVIYKNVTATVGTLVVDATAGDGEDKTVIADIDGVVYYGVANDVPDLGELGNKVATSIPAIRETVEGIAGEYVFADGTALDYVTVKYYDAALGLTLVFDIEGVELSENTVYDVTVYLGEPADDSLVYDVSVTLGEDGYVFEAINETEPETETEPEAEPTV